MKQFDRASTVGFHQKSRCIVGYETSTKTLQIGEQSYYLLCSDTPETPTLQPMVSISCSVRGREIIYLEPTSALLERYYQQLRQTVAAPKSQFIKFTHDLIAFTRGILGRANQDLIDGLIANPANPQVLLAGQGPESIPAVNLEHFINANTGWCRHHAMLNWYFLQRLRLDDLLPAGRVIHYRCLMATGLPHALVVFVHSEQDTLQVIDSALNQSLQLPSQAGVCRGRYSEDFYKTICDRYLPLFNDCAPTQPLLLDEEEESQSDRMLISSSR